MKRVKKFKNFIFSAVALLICTAMLTFAAMAEPTSEEGENASSQVSSESSEQESSSEEQSGSSEDEGSSSEGVPSEETSSEATSSEEDEGTSSEYTETSSERSNDEESEGSSSRIIIASDIPYGTGGDESWTSGDMDVSAVQGVNSTPSTAKKNIADPKKVITRWMILSIIIMLITIGALVAINLNYRKTNPGSEKKKLKKTRKVPRRPRD